MLNATPVPKLDLKRLRADVKRIEDNRPADGGPGGRRITGSMAIVRENLPALLEMRAKGGRWVDIAAGLALQGVTQGASNGPITGKRLTALIASIRNQEARKAAKQAQRAQRRDVGKPFEGGASSRSKLRLAPELTRQAPAQTDSAAAEEAIRRSGLATVQALFKQDDHKGK